MSKNALHIYIYANQYNNKTNMQIIHLCERNIYKYTIKLRWKGWDGGKQKRVNWWNRIGDMTKEWNPQPKLGVGKRNHVSPTSGKYLNNWNMYD